MNKKSRANALIAVLLCIPLFFIIYFACVYASQAIPLDGVYKVELTMPDSTPYVFEDSTDVRFFCDLLTDVKEIRSPVRDISGETPMKLAYVDTGSKQHYDFYPTLNIDGCMVYSDKGRWYLLSESAATSFLCRSECLYLYRGSMTPSLIISDGTSSQSIAPTDYYWSYRKIDGNFYTDKMTPTYDGTVARVYSTADFVMSCQLDGGSFDLKFLKDGEELEDIHSFSDLKFDTDTYLDVTVSAKWTQSSSADYYGDVDYSFKLLYDVPATVRLSRSAVTAGGFVALQLENCCEDEQLTVKTELYDGEISIYAGFDGDGDRYALIPVDIGTAPGIYTVDLSAPGYSDSVEISVSAFKPENLVLLSETEEEYNSMLDREILASVGETLLSPPVPEDYAAYYPIGSAFKPAVSGKPSGVFGDEYVVRTGGTTYNLPGDMYSIAHGTSVYAAQRGVVVFARATASTGNTVIIDHGYGIRTYYFNLSTISVTEGTIASAGSIIGATGSTGFTWTYDSLLNVAVGGGDMFQFAVSIGGVFVDGTPFTSGLKFNQ